MKPRHQSGLARLDRGTKVSRQAEAYILYPRSGKAVFKTSRLRTVGVFPYQDGLAKTRRTLTFLASNIR